MKSRKSGKSLSAEDRHLWKRVADTTTPLSRKRGQFLKEEMAKLMGATSTAPAVNKSRSILASDAKPNPAPPTPAMRSTPSSPLVSHPIDAPVLKKLVQGRLNIDARIDLHGMSQDRARFALYDFLQMAQRADQRLVLVITGKGNEGRGILRTNVPLWLGLPGFTNLVNGFRQSHPSHGGEGALYVRIRKPSNRPGRRRSP